MKRRITCLLLSLLLVFSAFNLFGCSSSDTDKDKNEENKFVRNPMTLSLWIPTYEGTSQNAIAQVEAALNKITKAQFNTAIELHLIQSDKYETQVDSKLKEVNEVLTRTEEERKAQKQAEREAKKRGETLAVTETQTAEVTGDPNSDGVIYPSVTSTQFDIFLVRGYDKFMEYASGNQLSQIDDELNGSSKLIKSYVYPTFLQQATLYGSTLAVPNNHPIGKYTYLLINKELCDSYYYDPDEMTSLTSCKDFIEDVGVSSDITPLLGEVTTPGLRYWSSDGSYSVLATMILDDSDPTSKLNVRNIMGLKSYVSTTLMMKQLKEAGCIGTNPNELNFGVGVVEGTTSDLEKYGELKYDEDGNVTNAGKYYVKVLCRPRAAADDIYRAMFAVSSYTKDTRRAMEIVRLLNTDSTFRTILQYGVEGVHWQIDPESPKEDPYIKLLSDDYKMELVETGNVFETYPAPGVPMSQWADGRKQNQDSLLDPLVRFTNYIDDKNKEYFDQLDKYSADMLAKINAMSAAEFEANASALQDEIGDSDPFFWLTNSKQDKFDSLVMKYSDYYAEFIQPKN